MREDDRADGRRRTTAAMPAARARGSSTIATMPCTIAQMPSDRADPERQSRRAGPTPRTGVRIDQSKSTVVRVDHDLARGAEADAVAGDDPTMRRADRGENGEHEGDDAEARSGGGRRRRARAVYGP